MSSLSCILLGFLMSIIFTNTSAMIRSLRPAAKRIQGFSQFAAAASSGIQQRDINYNVAFLFPGQGAQSVGMGVALCGDFPSAKTLYDKASDILGYDLLEQCTNGPKEKLDSTAISQPAIFVSSMACVEKLRVQDPAALESCTVAMGLSLGEYSALCFAGAFSFEDGVRLTKARGEAMQAASDASESGMVAILGLDSAAVQEICDAATFQSGEPLHIANYLSEGNYAVSGGRAACLVASQIAPTAGARMAVPLAVAGAFHTDYMLPAVEPLRQALATVNFNIPRIPVVSNVDSQAHFDASDIRDVLARQVTSPVLWERAMTDMTSSSSFQRAVELGPGTVCRGILKRMNKKIDVSSVQA